MMHKLAVFAGLLLSGSVAMAAPKGYEAPISEVGTVAAITVSTSAFTMVPTTESVYGRSGIMVGIKDSTSTFVSGVLGDCTSTAEAITDASIIISEKTFVFIPITNGICLWLRSGPEGISGSAADTVYVQDVKQF